MLQPIVVLPNLELGLTVMLSAVDNAGFMYSVPSLKNETQLAKTIATLNYLERCVKNGDWKNARELMEVINRVGKLLLKYSFEETAIHNTVLRFMKLIREESLRLLPSGKVESEGLQSTLVSSTSSNDWSLVGREELCKQLLTASIDLKTDIKGHLGYISSSSLNFIHSDELILTVGYSKSVFNFLKYAANKKRQFRVIVCEAFPNTEGHKMAETLAMEEISVVLVPDSHAFGLMARVNKVILSCDTVYPDGSLKAQTGTYAVMLAAKHFSIPTYVCLPSYKISPVNFKLLPNCSNTLNSHAQCAPESMTDFLETADLSVNSLDAPSRLLPASECLAGSGPSPLVWLPNWDYIPPGLTSLFLTTEGGQAPSYLYAMVRELFNSDDVNQSLKWVET
ncbi:Translation initiation factor eIF-2B subunit beta [Echinococcus granulosus]|uniref:Translation initiation factor eIF2B subunit beta n=1 Tax=Echinococcus granulosus TaxID=6210 RepID=W6US51_ECHGR|nr:Translation initiation factor eIF-2B subunit beta [Echinococcus granulosus]EUB63471.1 Translation initiation factor eIF-2B subunit beta [Echinococcus granulosus]